MHFVKKVPTTEEERAVKQKERLVKMKIFCTVRDKIFEKRKLGELDQEMLQATRKILEKNPDIYTYWNIRREVITKFEKDWKSITEESDYGSKICALLDEELVLTQSCIEANPKSYSAWFQRGWVLERHPKPNFKMDLALCEKALKMDCRNFHCWDHRRTVARMANLPVDEEIAFSNRLIGDNFSNYSAWHFRSHLLPRIQKINSGTLCLDDSTIISELEKVTNAAFVDPEDQSAWVYSRWLIEMGSIKEQFHHSSSSLLRPVTVTHNSIHSTVVMSKPCSLEDVLSVVKSAENSEWKGVSPLCPTPLVSRIWLCFSSDPLELINEDGSSTTVTSSQPFVNRDLINSYYNITCRPPTVAIETMISNCKDLMEEMKDEKERQKTTWALYTSTLCLMEAHPIESHEEVVHNLEKLATELDPQRKNVYLSIRDRQVISAHLRSDDDGITVLDRLLKGEGCLRIAGKRLRNVDSLEMLAGFITDIDLSENCLHSIDSLTVLPNLTSITLTENKVNRLFSPALSSFSSLEFLSLASCPIDNVDDITQSICQLPSLGRFLFAETPLSEKGSEVQAKLPDDQQIRLIPHWL